MSDDSALRSVSIADDLMHPCRLAHYVPTPKSMILVRSVLEGGPVIAIAPYGSGKSLAAAVGLLLARNAPQDAEWISSIRARLSPDDFALSRHVGSQGAFTVVLNGAVSDLASELATAAGSCATGLERALAALDGAAGEGRVSIVWDEFGRHLESLAAAGLTQDLQHVQRLAEWTARRVAGGGLTVILHQGMSAYADGLSRDARNEWRKVEGRFRVVRFHDDSTEMLRVAAAAIAARRGGGSASADTSQVEGAVELGWFGGADSKAASAIIRDAWPLTAAAFHALPALAARLGQNERSLIGFVNGVDLDRPVGMTDLYEVFAPAMRADAGVGGLHRLWMETEAGRRRAGGDIQDEAVTAACLLSIDAGGARRPVPYRALILALDGRFPGADAEGAVASLVAGKSLMRKRSTDDVTVRQGPESDIPARLMAERAASGNGFDALAFLAARHPAPHVRAIRHNATKGTARYLRGCYADAQALLESGPSSFEPSADEDGRIVYVIAATRELASSVRASLLADGPDATVFVVPVAPVDFHSAALEVHALERLATDAALLESDPLAAGEIAELLSDARRHLAESLDILTTDRPSVTAWINRGTVAGVDQDRPAAVLASTIMDAVYPLTPRINNDQVMRRSLSRSMTTARVRVTTRILEQPHLPDLGFSPPEMTLPAASVYRTVLLHTGLHIVRDGSARLAEPHEIADPALRAVWQLLKDTFTLPATTTLSDIVDSLKSSPFGIPEGVIPIIVMAGYRAFAQVAAFTTDRIYVPDLLGFDCTRMFVEPSRHTLTVYPSSPEDLAYLSGVACAFGGTAPAADDEHLRFAWNAFRRWWGGLPDGAKRGGRSGTPGYGLAALARVASDPCAFLLHDLPGNSGAGNVDAKVAAIRAACGEIDRLAGGSLAAAARIVSDSLAMGEGGIRAWAACIDHHSLLASGSLKLVDQAVLRTVSEALSGVASEESLARALSLALLKRGPEAWQDQTPALFSQALVECRARIEDAAASRPGAGISVLPILDGRIAALQATRRRILDHSALEDAA